MTRTLGNAPEHLYEPSACNAALLSAGLPLDPPQTGVRYSRKELLAIRETPGGVPFDEWRYYRRAVSTAAVARRRDDAVAD